MKNVTKEEFEAFIKAFIKAYPHPLRLDVAMMYEPPLLTYNDFALGNWPESIVAACSAGYYKAEETTDHMVKE